MANTYTQIHIQAIFAVQNRDCIIRQSWQTELYKYITGIVQRNNHKLLAINGMPDHIHILFGFRPTQPLSDLMQDVKGDSSKWINLKGLVKGTFSWQEGYGAFSYSKREVSAIADYIEKQKEHHRIKSFTKEYLDFLDEFGIDFDNRFIFKPVDYSVPNGTD